MSTAVLTSWLLTYLVHSTILLSAAWLISRVLGDRHLGLQEILLRTALVGGIVTASVQLGLGIEPVGGAVAIGVTQSTAMTAPAEGGAAKSAADSYVSDGHHQAGLFWAAALLILWGGGALALMLALSRSMIDLRRLLMTRRFRPTGRLIERLSAALGLRRSVRLSTTAAIAVPFATGIRRPEICCPERVGDLAPEHRKSLFAHELAHLVRRDPAWQLFYRISEAVLFMQPLNKIVRRRLEDIAEHLTDARAVACTGDRLGLARCLVVVAHWGISTSPGVPATAFAAGPRLDRRVRHLISDTFGHRPVARWVAPALMALVLGTITLLPLVTPFAAHADSPASDAASESATTWSTSSDKPGEVPPAPPARPVPQAVPVPIAPTTETLPVPEIAPQSVPSSRPVSAPAPIAEPAPETAPEPHEPPEPPAATEKPAPEESARSERARTLARERASHRERTETASRERERARVLAEEGRRLTAEARRVARESAEQARLTAAEREKMRAEATELARLAEIQARELARQAREGARLTDTQREEIRRRAEASQEQARERARETERLARERAAELAEQARLLAEQAEAERQREAERRAKEQEEEN